ncbi:MAG: 2-isopropylmalate synthase [Promethearchaeota archaeon]
MTTNKNISVSQMMEKLQNQMNLPPKAFYFDTTLRDGEQTHGIVFNVKEKLEIARSLDNLGIDVIEAGFPVVSEGDFLACKKIGKLGLKAEIAGLARLNQKDIDRAVEADVDTIHVFIATSDIHLKNKLKMTQDQVMASIEKYVSIAKSQFTNVVFSAEDATRTSLNFLLKCNALAVESGATRINIPDTVGTITPRAYGYVIKEHYEKLPKNIRISAHCHNDFGLGVANTVAAFENGASEAQTTILGLGERAGNASFEETAMSLYALYGLESNIIYNKIYPTAKLIERYCGGKISIGRLTPLIGKNAFSHESGIHAHAMIQNARTYEPISPSLLGIPRSDSKSAIVAQSIKLGKHTGNHALQAKINAIGINPTDEQFSNILSSIKRIGDKGHEIREEEFLAIVKDVMGEIPEQEKYVILEELSVMTGSVTPTATVRLKIRNNGDFTEKIESSVGNGPIDASINAIVKCFSKMSKIMLLSFDIEAITGGTDALGHVTIEVMDIDTNIIVSSNATHEDVVMSSVLAMIKALNKIVQQKNLH